MLLDRYLSTQLGYFPELNKKEIFIMITTFKKKILRDSDRNKIDFLLPVRTVVYFWRDLSGDHQKTPKKKQSGKWLKQL